MEFFKYMHEYRTYVPFFSSIIFSVLALGYWVLGKPEHGFFLLFVFYIFSLLELARIYFVKKYIQKTLPKSETRLEKQVEQSVLAMYWLLSQHFIILVAFVFFLRANNWI